MHSHIDKAYTFLDDHLPATYSAATHNILKENGAEVSISIITNVRNRINERVDVLNALLQVAQKNKAQVEELINKVS